MEKITLSSIIENFPFSHVHMRFLCGASALREARHISRMQFYMGYGGVDDTNPITSILVSDIQKYESAKAFLLSKKRITTKDLLKVHEKLFKGVKHAGKLRVQQNWIGKSRESATYIPPPAENLKHLLCNFFNTINDYERLSTEDVIKVYCEFLMIHPFLDGNGRTSRILIDYMLQKADLKTHISLYRLGIRISAYQDAVSSFGIRSNIGIESPYWKKMVDWIEQLEKKQYFLLQELKKILTVKLALTPLNCNDLRIIELLLKQPIVNIRTVSQMLDIKADLAKDSLSRLVNAGVLKLYKTRQNEINEVLVCVHVCEFIMKLDELLFLDKEGFVQSSNG